MADKQVALTGSGNVEIEQESTEQTTLSEVHKETDTTKSHEKSAKFEATANTSIVEENASKNIQSSCNASQSTSESVTKIGQVTQTTFSSAHSFSMEETEEYEYEG